MGSIITFYSYKGGVGRSMALANIAYLLAEMGKSVLCIDWDLEAPGLADYFTDHETKHLPEPNGLLSILENSKPGALAPWPNYVQKAVTPNGFIHLLASGKHENNYRERLHGFSWSAYFKNNDGGSVIEALRDEWKNAYDYVLIDSRTGFNDAAGVCTIQLPDILVLMFTANRQSVEGCVEAAGLVRANHDRLPYDREYLTILPILSRFDEKEESAHATVWKDKIATDFASFYRDWLPKRIPPKLMIPWITLPYVPRYSFGETLAVKEQGTQDPQLLGYYYQTITRLLVTKFHDARSILIAGGVKEAEVEPILPGDPELNRLLRNDPGYARRKADEIFSFTEAEQSEVITSLRRLAEESETLRRFSDSEEIVRRCIRFAQSFGSTRADEVAHLMGYHASLLSKLGRVSEGEAKYREGVNFARNALGDGENLLALLSDFAHFLMANDRLVEAEERLREALKCAESVFSAQDSRLAAQYVDFAEFLSKEGEKRGALALKLEAAKFLERSLAAYSTEVEPQNVSDSAFDTALQRQFRLFISLGKYKEAVDVAAQMLMRAERRHPSDPRALCDALEQYGWAHEYYRGQYLKAIELYDRSLVTKAKNWGADSVTYGATCLKLAEAYTAANSLVDARLLCNTALKISRVNLGTEHPDVANALAGLADVEIAEGNLQNAEELLREALRIRIRAFGSHHRWAALSYNHLALLLCERGRYSEARELHRQAREIDDHIYGSLHAEVAFDDVSLARVISLEGDFATATPLWEKGLPILEHAYGASHDEVARKRAQFSEHLVQAGDLGRAQYEMRKAVADLQESLGSDHRYTRAVCALAARLQIDLTI